MLSVMNPTLQNRLLEFLDDRAKAAPDLGLLEWTRRYRSQLVLGREFDLSAHKYLAAIYNDNSQQMVIQKAGQVGASEYLISWVLWSCDVRQCTGLYLFPTDTHVSDFSTARIGPAVSYEVSPYLAGIISDKDVVGRKVERVGLKRIRNRFLYMRGAKVQQDGRAPQLRSIDADVVVLDEFDEMNPQAEALAMERLGHSKIAESRIASTPTYPTVGIHPLYNKTDRCKWIVACPHCGNKQPLELLDLVIEFDDTSRPVKFYQDENGNPYLACRRCKGAMDRLADGEWVAEDPSQPVRGYHLSRLFMAHKPLQAIIEGLQSSDESRRQETYRQALGLPYRPASSMSLDAGLLDNCRRNYKMGTSRGSRFYMGVDVGRVLHVVIREIMNDGEMQARYIGTVQSFDEELAYLMNRFKVRCCVIDALPETRAARKFQEQFYPGKVWVCYYQEKKHTEPSEVYNVNELSVSADRTRTLDTTLAGFVDASNGKPGKTLFSSIRDVPDYYAQLTAIERVLEKSADGNQVARYIGDPDHYAHAENYCDIAMRSPIGWSRGSGG